MTIDLLHIIDFPYYLIYNILHIQSKYIIYTLIYLSIIPIYSITISHSKPKNSQQYFIFIILDKITYITLN